MRNFYDYLKRMRYALLAILLIIIASTILAFYNLQRFEEFSTFNLQHEGIILSNALEASIASESDLENVKELQARIDRFTSASDSSIELNIMVIKGDWSEIIASNEPGNIEETSEEEHQNLLSSLKLGKPVAFIGIEDEDDDDDEDILEAEKEGTSVVKELKPGERFLSITTPLIFNGNGLGSINTKLSLESIDQKIGAIRLSIQIAAIVEIILVLAGFGILVKLFMEEKLGLVAEESMRYQAELKALQSQVNPHFLFNTLNSLTSLISTHPERAEELTIEISDLLRKILGASKKGWWTIEEEVELVNNYLNIESVRLGNKLNFAIQVKPELYSLEIPCLIVEPLVENAVQHGINSSISGGEIKIKIIGQSALQIVVEDKIILNENYPRSPVSPGEQIGLKNVKKRLKLIYGNSGSFKLHKSVNGAAASITIENFGKHKGGKV